MKVIRLSDVDTSFKFPKDLYHVKITSMEIYEALVLFDECDILPPLNKWGLLAR